VALGKRGVRQYEGTSIGKKDLRQMQSHPSPRRGPGNLRQPETQTAARLSFDFLILRVFVEQEKSWHVSQVLIFQ
jgi:hypothetical protein